MFADTHGDFVDWLQCQLVACLGIYNKKNKKDSSFIIAVLRGKDNFIKPLQTQ